VHRGVGHQGCDVLGFLLFGLRIRVADDQRGRPVHARKDVPHVRLPQNPGQCLGDVGADGVPGDARIAPHDVLVDGESVTLVVRHAKALCRAVLRLLKRLLCRPQFLDSARAASNASGR
jgi:hypothetical protein